MELEELEKKVKNLEIRITRLEKDKKIKRIITAVSTILFIVLFAAGLLIYVYILKNYLGQLQGLMP